MGSALQVRRCRCQESSRLGARASSDAEQQQQRQQVCSDRVAATHGCETTITRAARTWWHRISRWRESSRERPLQQVSAEYTGDPAATAMVWRRRHTFHLNLPAPGYSWRVQVSAVCQAPGAVTQCTWCRS